MPTIKDKLLFNFDGIWSNTFNLVNVVLNNSMYEESLIATRGIIETKIKGSKPLFHRLEDMPLEFEMTIAFEDKFNDTQIDSIIKWLFTNSYKPLYFENDENKIYYCMPINDSQLVHNGLGQGYFTINMRCDSSNVYSPIITTSTVNIVGTGNITVENDGHFEIYPEISIIKNGIGTIIIESLNDNNSIFEIRDLTNLENIYINCEKEIIQTDAVGVYRYDKLVGYFPRMIFGSNTFKITGDCSIQFRYKRKYRF